MEAMLSVALIATPPAFVAGWLLSKSVLRRSAAQPDALAGEAMPATQPAAGSDSPVAETTPADDKRLVALRNEITLLREGVAERDHQLQNLRQNLKSQPVPPEDTPGTARATLRKSMEQAQARLAAREAQVAELQREIDAAGEKSRRRIVARIGLARQVPVASEAGTPATDHIERIAGRASAARLAAAGEGRCRGAGKFRA